MSANETGVNLALALIFIQRARLESGEFEPRLEETHHQSPAKRSTAAGQVELASPAFLFAYPILAGDQASRNQELPLD